MSKILFLTSAHPTGNVGLSFREKRFPLGIGFLVSVVRNAGHKVDFYDRYLFGPGHFPEDNYDFVGIYSNTPCFKDTLRIVNHYKGKAKIIVGGPHTSVYPETLNEDIDFIVQGEGEQAIIDILEGKAKQRILRYPRIKNLDSLPTPAYGVFKELPYRDRVPWFKTKPVWVMNTSRGCPFNCVFCNVKDIWGREYTCFSSNRVVEDMKFLQKTYGVKGIYFREDNFTCSRKRVERICNLLMKGNVNMNWCCETRVDTLDEHVIERMSAAGCKAFYVGFESGSQRMLNIYNKGTKVEQGLKIVEWARKYNIKIAGSFIKDHPKENLRDKKLTRNFIRVTKPHTVWINKWRANYDKFIK